MEAILSTPVVINRLCYCPRLDTSLSKAEREKALMEYVQSLRTYFPWVQPYEPSLFLSAMSNFRYWYVRECAWHFLPSERVIKQQMKLFIGSRAVLEIGAGKGLLARAVHDLLPGVRWIATDIKPATPNTFYPVEQLDHREALAKYPTDILAMCWPAYNEDWTHETLELFQGKYVIYIGEDEHGCTGSERFHQQLGEHWVATERKQPWIDIPQFDTLHDALVLYRRKSLVEYLNHDECKDLNEHGQTMEEWTELWAVYKAKIHERYPHLKDRNF